tara:strand:+ start:73 stop:222 length:150 start_codon:yes stop_codon:yes gene_type:complete
MSISSIEDTETSPAGATTQAFHFFVALFYKGTTILSTMRLKLENMTGSD